MDTRKIHKKYYGAQDQSMMKLFREWHYENLRLDDACMLSQIPQCDKNKFREWNQSRGAKRYKYIMLTINFIDGVVVAEAVTKIEKSLTKKYVLNWIWCLEWRSAHGGMHSHIRIEISDTKNPYDVKREFYNTFKNLVGNKLHINTRYSNIDGAFINYVKGLKGGLKKDNHDNDVLLRSKFSLKNFYCSWVIEK